MHLILNKEIRSSTCNMFINKLFKNAARKRNYSHLEFPLMLLPLKKCLKNHKKILSKLSAARKRLNKGHIGTYLLCPQFQID